MFDYLKTFVENFGFNTRLGIVVYWIPLFFCAYGYTVRTWINYQKDVLDRSIDKYYYPTDTIGDLIGRGLITIMPVGNLLAAIFDVAPRLFESFFRALKKIFTQPLVPKKEKNETN
jgi:hypothetical protein